MKASHESTPYLQILSGGHHWLLQLVCPVNCWFFGCSPWKRFGIGGCKDCLSCVLGQQKLFPTSLAHWPIISCLVLPLLFDLCPWYSWVTWCAGYFFSHGSLFMNFYWIIISDFWTISPMLNVPRLRMSDTRASGLTKNIGLHFMTVAPLSTTVPCDLGHDFL